MWFRVAALLGRTVAELQQTITSAEFADWCAYYTVEPWGYEVSNWRAGLVAATSANFSGRAKKSLKPSDFMPRGERRTRRMTGEELHARLSADITRAAQTHG